jgi:hypothetical protein
VRRGTIGCLVGLALGGCPGGNLQEQCELAAAEPATVDLGVGDAGFVALEEGGTATIVQGPQGGYHVFGSVSATGLYLATQAGARGEDLPLVSFTIDTPGGERLGGFVDAPTFFREGPGGEALVIGALLVLDVEDPPSLDGDPAVFEVQVVDACGTEVGEVVSGVLGVE